MIKHELEREDEMFKNSPKEDEVLGFKLKPQIPKEACRGLLILLGEDYVRWFDASWDQNVEDYGFNFSNGFGNKPNKLTQVFLDSGVLDIWFDKVYDETPKVGDCFRKNNHYYQIREKDILHFKNGEDSYCINTLSKDHFPKGDMEKISWGEFTHAKFKCLLNL